VFGSYLASWYGDDYTGNSFWPFLTFLGGVGQFAAGMWSFRGRDTLSSVIHTMWGSYWIATGVFYALRVPGNVPISPYSNIDAFAIWQVPLAAFTWAACIATLFRDWTMMLILGTMATGSTLSVIGWFASSSGVIKAGAYLWLISSALMWYRVTAYFLTETTHKEHLLPLFRHPHDRHGRNKNIEAGNHEWVVPYREAGVVAGEW